MENLGWGSLVPGRLGGQPIAVDVFMRTVLRLYPHVLRECAENVKDPAALLDRRERPVKGRLNLEWVPSSALREWCIRWHLTAQPIYRWAARTVEAWDQDPRMRGKLTWERPPSPAPEPWRDYASRDARVVPIEGFPEREFRSDFMARAQAHWKHRCGTLESRGWVAVPTKTEPKHFEWLARYQCGGESLGAIARSVNDCDVVTISSAVKATARLLGLRLRPPAKGGRPTRQR